MGARASVFIGSSKEGLPVAEHVQLGLGPDVEATLWNQDVFELGKTTIESLVETLDAFDFAVLVLTPDDVSISRATKKQAPRDNVLFELGLYMGRLGRDRCYFIFDADAGIKLPSDLSGVTAATFRRRADGNLAAAVGPACTQIRGMIQKLGTRPKLPARHLEGFARVCRFLDEITGPWWERIRPDDASALSYTRIERDRRTGLVKIHGDAYSAGLELVAHWESLAVAVEPDERRLVYHWQGWFPARPNEPFEGFGEFRFSDATGACRKGSGFYLDVNLTRLENTTKKAAELRRIAVGADLEVMQGVDGAKIKALLRRVLDAW
jgi:hypothetical protein